MSWLKDNMLYKRMPMLFKNNCVINGNCFSIPENLKFVSAQGGSSFYVRWGFTSSKVGVHIE